MNTTCYLTLTAVLNAYGEVDRIKPIAVTQTRPKDPRGVVVELDLDIDEQVFKPITLSASIVVGRPTMAAPDSPWERALKAAVEDDE